MYPGLTYHGFNFLKQEKQIRMLKTDPWSRDTVAPDFRRDVFMMWMSGC